MTGTLDNGLYLMGLAYGPIVGGTFEIWGAQMELGTSPGAQIVTPGAGASGTVATGQTPILNGMNESYAYDSFGNILNNNSFSASYTANNQMFGYSYDGAGNFLSDGINRYSWDAESRITTAGGTTYIYDAEGNRVEKQGVGVTDTIYFGGRPIARYSAGQWTDLVYGPTGLLAEVPGTQAGLPEYRMTDHLGNVVGNLSSTGAFTNPVDYMPFGQVFAGGTNDPYMFTGKERDAESGLDYFGARYYASSMGRWMSPDWSAKVQPVPYAKLDNPQSLNLYSYVGSNPLSRFDADGHVEDPTKKPSPVEHIGMTISQQSALVQKTGLPISTDHDLVVIRDTGGTPGKLGTWDTRSVDYSLHAHPDGGTDGPVTQGSIAITEHQSVMTLTKGSGTECCNTGMFQDSIGPGGDKSGSVTVSFRYFTGSIDGKELGVLPVRDAVGVHLVDRIEINTRTDSVKLNGTTARTDQP